MWWLQPIALSRRMAAMTQPASVARSIFGECVFRHDDLVSRQSVKRNEVKLELTSAAIP